MRIAYITQSYPPMVSGAAIFARQLAEAMSERGHQVLVIAASDRDESYFVQNNNLSILRLRSHHNPLRVNQRSLLYPRNETLQALREFRPDIIHSHDPLQMGMLATAFARKAGIPITLTAHQLPWFAASYLPDKYGLRDLVEKVLWMYVCWLTRQFTSVIAPTKTIATLIAMKTNVQPQTISCGLDIDSFHPPLSLEEAALRTRLALPANVPIILYVGRLDTDKRVNRVIAAAAQVLRKTDAHLLIVGDGCQRPALMKLCKSLGIADQVRFTGCISVQDGLPEIYRLANLFVTASEIETQGIVLLEAAASGLPIVAVRATCIPEIVHHDLNGYLAESGDINGLENNIRLLLKDPLKARAMGEAGRTLVESHATQHTMDLHEKHYQGLILQTSMQLIKLRSARRRKFTGGWIKS